MRHYPLIVLIAVSGCAQGKWYHPTADQAKFEQDRRECQYDAEKATVNLRSGIEAGMQQSSFMRQCMQIRGYEYRTDPG